MKPLITTYKYVNNQRIEFVEQTKATVKTNNKTLELPLFITEATTSVDGIKLDATVGNTSQHQ